MRRELPRSVEWFYAIFAVVLLTGAFVPLFREQAGFQYQVQSGDRVHQAILGALYLVGLVLLVHHLSLSGSLLRVQTRVASAAPVALIAFVGLAFISAAWSINPRLTVRGSLGLAGATLVGLYLGQRFSRGELTKVVAMSLLGCVVISFIVASLFPSVGVMMEPIEGAWRGIFVRKNDLGLVAALSGLVCLISAARAGWRLGWLAGVMLSALSLLLARSVTPLAALVAAVLFGVVFYELRVNRLRRLWVGLLLMLPVGMIAVTRPAFLLDLVGRGTNLTGRTEIWSGALLVASERPFLGYGYRAFWQGTSGPSGRAIEDLFWTPDQAHSAYLDLVLQVGVLGLALWTGAVVLTLLRLGRQDRSPSVVGVSAIIAFVLVYGVAEARPIAPNQLIWTLLVALAVARPDLRDDELALRQRDRGNSRILILALGIEGYGGIQRYITSLADGLGTDDQPREVRLLALWDKRGRLSEGSFQRRGYGSRKLAFLFGYFDAVLRFRPNVVVVGHASLLPLLLLGRLWGAVPQVLITYGVEIWHPSRTRAYLVKRVVDQVVAIGDVTRRRVAEACRIPLERIALVAPPAECEGSVSHRLGASDARKSARLLTVCRLDGEQRRKGVDVLLNAFSAVVTSIPEATLQIVGEGSWRDELESQAESLGVASRVSFEGHLTAAELHDRYSVAEVFVLPSSGEGFGMVYVEAGLHGVPSIGCDVDGTRDAIDDGVSGILVGLGDSSALAAAICSLLSDSAMRKRMGFAAWAKAQHHSPERFRSSWRELVVELLAVPSNKAEAQPSADDSANTRS